MVTADMNTIASWQERYNKPRESAKKQKHHFADKGPYSQGYGLFSVTYGCESKTKKKAWHPKN